MPYAKQIHYLFYTGGIFAGLCGGNGCWRLCWSLTGVATPHRRRRSYIYGRRREEIGFLWHRLPKRI